MHKMDLSKWKIPCLYNWTYWKHILPFLSLDEMCLLSDVGPEFKGIVDCFLSNEEIVITGEFLRRFSFSANEYFFRYFGSSAKQLTLLNTLENDLALLRCFPHLQELAIKGAIIALTNVTGLPLKLQRLTISHCAFDQKFMEEYVMMLHLESLKVFGVNWSNCGLLDITHLGLEDIPIEGLFPIVTKFILSRYSPRIAEVKTIFPNLRHLTIVTPVDDTVNWDVVRGLAKQLKTLNSTFTAAKIDKLFDECFVEIMKYVDTEDLIALTHVNQRMRRIVINNVYPVELIKLSPQFKRYPVGKCLAIYKPMSQLVRRLCLEDVPVPEFYFPNLKHLTLDMNEAVVKEDEDITGIPDGLESLHIEEYGKVEQGLGVFLDRVLPNIRYLRDQSSLYIPVDLLTRLCVLDIGVDIDDLIGVLKRSPDLSSLYIRVQLKSTEDINMLLNALKLTPNLTKLDLWLEEDEKFKYDSNLLQEPVSLHKVKHLTLKCDLWNKDIILHFFRHIQCPNVIALQLNLDIEELESSPDSNTSIGTVIVPLVENLIHLETLRYDNYKMCMRDKLRLVSILMSKGRRLTINDHPVKTYKDILNNPKF